MWTKETLQELIRSKLGDHPLIMVANREPYLHRYKGDQIECVPPASGMVTAIEPIMRACGGVWVAHGSGSADQVTADERGRLAVPPDHPSYTLRRVWLTPEQEEGYYYGLSNEGLWPLCHTVFRRPYFDRRHWQVYREVNELFAQAVLEEAEDRPAFVFVQDYHFGLLPRILKNRNPNLIVAQFWHIPWPGSTVFETFPWKEELLDGLLGNDLLGFHVRAHCQRFLNTVDRVLEARVDRESSEVIRGGKSTLVRPFPISIDFDEHESAACREPVERMAEHWRERLGLRDKAVGIGIDRIDYTKGIPERLRALDRFLDEYPQWRGRLVFVQIGVPSRSSLPHYKALDEEIDRLVEECNGRWKADGWEPIVYLKSQHDSTQMMALHQLADFCIVSSLDDGMNLVAKEFVASRCDDDGVLILSKFTGAARELTSAILVNPFALDELADAIAQALEMPEDERRRRMHNLRANVEENNVYRWAGKFLAALLKLEAASESLPPEQPVAAGHLSAYEEVVD